MQRNKTPFWILAFLKSQPGKPYDAQSICKETGLPHSLVRKTLNRLHANGLISRLFKGEYAFVPSEYDGPVDPIEIVKLTAHIFTQYKLPHTLENRQRFIKGLQKLILSLDY
jgi:hypothetical protein